MRNGRLLTEESPSQLMNRYNTSSLEDIFLRLSQQQLNAERRESKTNTDEINDVSSTYQKGRDKKLRVPCTIAPQPSGFHESTATIT